MNTRVSKTPASVRKARYHLRLGLTPRHAQVEAAALLKLLDEVTIEEVIFFAPAAETISSGLATRQEIAESVERLRPLFAELRQRGVAPSINIWWTQSFSHFPTLPRNQRDQFDFRWAVRPDGYVSLCVACPRCESWRAYTRQMYADFAALKPERIWIDDDVHPTLRADMHTPCFCASCVAEMARRCACQWEVQELVGAIRAEAPNETRDAWLDFQGEIMVEIVAGLTRAVHAVSPATHMGLMHSLFESHCTEGRQWDKVVAAMGGPTPYVRPPLGAYVENTAPDLASGFAHMRVAQCAIGARVVHAPEIEYVPHNRFSKSVAVGLMQMQLAQLCGMDEVTLSIFRFEGRLDLELRRGNAWPQALRRLKPRLQAITDLDIKAAEHAGVALYFNERVTRFTSDSPAGDRPLLARRQRPWDTVLPILGFAVRPGKGDVTAIAGESLAALSRAELADLFTQGVMLDSRATDQLLKRGLGHWAGVAAHNSDAPSSHETIEDARFGGLVGDAINTRGDGWARQYEWLAGAKAISTLRDYTAEPSGDGVVIYTNELGGRVAVYPFDSQQTKAGYPYANSGFMSAPRQAQLRDLLAWLRGRPLPLIVHTPTPVYPMLIKQSGRWVVALANLSPDPLEVLDFEIEKPPFAVTTVCWLDETGSWRRAAAEIAASGMDLALRLVIRQRLQCFEVAVVTIAEG